MSDQAPKRRWFRFGLRTLLVAVALFGCLLTWLTYEMNWVRQRRHEIITGSVVTSQEYVRSPGILPMLGERGYKSIAVLIPNCHQITADDEEKANRIQRLFPEAEVNMMSGTPGQYLEKSSPYHPLNRRPDG